MKYGDITLYPKVGTVFISPAVAKSYKHYPGTDITEGFYLGRPATIVRCTCVVKSEADYLALRAAAHANVTAALYMDYGDVANGKYYADVEASIQDENILRDDGWYLVNIVFTCKDPIPYLTATSARLY